MSKEVNSSTAIAFNKRIYRVFEYDSKVKCSKGNAYIIRGDTNVPGMINIFSDMVLPCHGKCDFNYYLDAVEPGIYITERGNRIILPNVPDVYTINRVRDSRDPVLMEEIGDIDDTTVEVSMHMSGDAYVPKIRVVDDFLNKIFKMFLSLKQVSINIYNNRLGSEKYNFLRAMETNKSLSPTKLLEYLNMFDGQAAIIVTDKPNAKHPSGMKICIFTHDEFDFSDAILFDDASVILEKMLEDRADSLEE